MNVIGSWRKQRRKTKRNFQLTIPASLMMAFKAHAITTDVRVDGEETMTARWVTRDEYTAELIAGRMAAPGRATIARYMIEEWLGREL